jgi:hypothetical protein
MNSHNLDNPALGARGSEKQDPWRGLGNTDAMGMGDGDVCHMPVHLAAATLLGQTGTTTSGARA